MTATLSPPRPRTRRPETPRRRPGARRRAVLAALIVLAFLAVAAAGVWLVYFSTVLGTRQVDVTGVKALSGDVVRQAAAVPMNRPLARQDLDAIAQRATTVPAVEAATVTLDWPHTVRITVTERRPALAVRQPDGYLVVDNTGVGFATRSDVPSGVLVADVNPDNRPLLAQIAQIAGALPDGLKRKVDRVTGSTQDDVTLVLDSGVTVTWGPSADSGLKAQVVTALLKRKGVKAIDVTSAHNPATR